MYKNYKGKIQMKYYLVGGIILAVFVIVVLVVITIVYSRSNIIDGPGTVNCYFQISQDKAKEMMARNDGHIIIDVRRQDEYDSGHIPGAILLPNEDIGTEKPAELPDFKQIILVYCRSGRRSKEASQKLFEMGYMNVYEFGGIIDWTGDIVKNVDIVFKNQGIDANIWILPETKENKSTTFWGKPTVSESKPGNIGEFTVYKEVNTEATIFRAIDNDNMYYEANGIILENGYTVIFKSGDSIKTFTVETISSDGQTVNVYPVFAAKL